MFPGRRKGRSGMKRSKMIVYGGVGDGSFRSVGWTLTDIAAHFDNQGRQFEDCGISNGGRFWYASIFMGMLGYESMSSFEQAINRAIGTCTTLGIPVIENFQQCHREIDGAITSDYKLSRFACYLVAMNGD